MTTDINTYSGVTSITLAATSEKDVALLTSMFDMTSSKRALRFRARVKRVSKQQGGVTYVTLDNDAYLSKHYMKTLGFECLTNLARYTRKSEKPIIENIDGTVVIRRSKQIDAFREAGRFYTKGDLILYCKTGSNLFRVYRDGKLHKRKIYIDVDSKFAKSGSPYLRFEWENDEKRAYVESYMIHCTCKRKSISKEYIRFASELDKILQ